MDVDLFVRLLSRGDLVGLRESLAAFRVWPQSVSRSHSSAQFEENLTFLRQVRSEYGIVADDRVVEAAATVSWRVRDLRRRGWAKLPRLWSRPLAGVTRGG